MNDKENLIAKYKELKEINQGRKPLFKDFLKYSNTHSRKLSEAFGSEAYSKLQIECGDNPNKLELERTPMSQILEQYGSLVRKHQSAPKTGDWLHAKLKPTPDAINKVNNLRWSDMPGAFLSEFGDKIEWKDVTTILKGSGTPPTETKQSKAFNDILEKIELWTPDRKRIIEEGYKIELRNYLEKFFDLEEEVGESNPDLLVNKKYPIEIKKDPTQSEYDRLLGQMIRHNKIFGSAIAVVTAISSQDRYIKFKKLFDEIHEKLGMKAEVVKK